MLGKFLKLIKFIKIMEKYFKRYFKKYIPKTYIIGLNRFAVPIDDWLRTSLYDWANDYLSVESKTNNYFDYKIINKRWEQHLSKKIGVNLMTVIIFLYGTRIDKMLVNFSGIFIFGLLLRIILALYSHIILIFY